MSTTTRSRLRRSIAVLTAVLAGLAGLLPATGPAAAADPELTVVWPEVTRLNPDVTPYIFDVHDTGPGQLVAVDWYGWHREDVAADGPHTFSMPSDGTGHITLQRCLPDSGCTVVATSPELEVRRQISLMVNSQPAAVGAQRVATFSIGVYPEGAPEVELSWRLTDQGTGETVASGDPATFVPRDEAGYYDYVDLPVAVPADLRSDVYDFVVEGAVDLPDFGHLVGKTSWAIVRVDNELSAPRVKPFEDVFYPYRDGYHDAVVTRVTGAEYVPVTVDVLDADGDRVKRVLDTQNVPGDWSQASWDGSLPGGRIAPPGTYTLKYRFEDAAGNVATTRRDVRVSGKRLVERTWDRTFTAASTVVDTKVGRCSTLARPARAGWAGSLGYHSMTRCAREDQAVVLTQNGVYVPESPTDVYGDLRISLRGAGASGSAVHPYIVMGYLRRRGDAFTHRVEIRRDGLHHGRTVPVTPLLRDRSRRPYVLWSVGLTAGSRYDVRSFDVRMTYYVLR